MQRLIRWLLPVLIVAEIILVRGGVLSIGQAVIIVVVMEAALAIVVVRSAIVAIRQFRVGRREQLDRWTAAEDALVVFLPRRVARFILLEPRLWACLARWVTRRYRYQAGDFPYHRGLVFGAFLIVILFTTPVEILLLELLIPWGWLRWAALVLAIYALIWMFGLYASLVVMPHRLTEDGVEFRFGVLNMGYVPYGTIRRIERKRQRTPHGGDGLSITESEPAAAHLSIGGRTEIIVELSEPTRFWSLGGLSRPVQIIHVAANCPDALVEALQKRLAPPVSSIAEARVDLRAGTVQT